MFGPISLKGLQQDRFQRITTGKLPAAEVAFVDETFKASSAILNAMPEGEELDAPNDALTLHPSSNFWPNPGTLRGSLTNKRA